jgi:hypothetical protein
MLRRPTFGVNLPSAGSRLLLLLIGPMLLRKEPNVWLWCCGSQRGRLDGQRCQSTLQQRCCCDGDSRGHHVTPLIDGELGAPPPHSLEVQSSSLVDSSRMACSDGDLVRTTPVKMTHESLPSGERLRLPKRLAMDAKLPKWMVPPEANPTSAW